MTTNKKVLFMVAQPPGLGAINHEIIDAILVAAAFDQDVGVLFTGDGVFQLHPASAEDLSDPRDHTKAMQAFAAYDVTRLYADGSSLEKRAMHQGDLALPVEILTGNEVAALIADHDVVLSG